jgi:DNA sulfur modification protein DndD
VKLHQVELYNIRQFVGRQVVTFATDKARKVTLIHGPNTGGKTTLLNAIYWCFYGSFLSDFEDHERIRSREAENDDFWVEVRFEQAGKLYVARRAGRGAPCAATLQVLESRTDGRSIPHPQPELLIASILPEALAHFFFFAGEMIKKGLSSGTVQKGAGDAIRAVLGLRLAECALDDLSELQKKKRRELKQLCAGTDLSEITSDLDDAEQFVESRRAQLVAQSNLVAQLEAEKRSLFDQLRGIESSSALQRRRDVNETQLARAKAELERAQQARQDVIADSGAAAFLEPAAAIVSTLIDSAVTQKKIPSPFDRTFVQDILESKVCVCGRAINPGTKEYKEVASLINSATDEATIRGALAVRAIAQQVQTSSRALPRLLKRSLENYQAAHDRIEELEQEGARVRDLLQRHEERNVRQLENQLEGVERNLREFTNNKIRTEEEIAARKQEIDRLRTELNRAQAASPQINQAKMALEMVETLIATLEAELDRVETDGINRISKSLNRVVGRSTREKYSATVTRDYRIVLYSESAGERTEVSVLSSGERRLVDLCFVAALVAVCRDRESEVGSILLPGAVAPMIVDAPFGELDPEYQALAATTMIELSEQLVLMLSKTHWTTAVDEAIRPQVGREYLMVGYRAGDALDAVPVEITVGGMTYQQMVYGSSHSWTAIESIGSQHA